jgi:regulator of protease activity HflC (stomatin/prohibitin superfamily)
MQTVTETKTWRMSGYVSLFLLFVFLAIDVYVLRAGILTGNTTVLWFVVPFTVFIIIFLGGFLVVQPNEARVLVLFGKYIGSAREAGFWWANPFASKKLISLRIRNFNSDKIKVNDLHGNPIEIAAVVVWQVVDTARALFDVENYLQFVQIQSETAIRALASEYPYDTQDEHQASLRGSPLEIAEKLKAQVQTRLEITGVSVLESRISHLAYSAEIAQAMLRRQQAQAIIAARQKIVEALVSDREVSPVINTGTLYQ